MPAETDPTIETAAEATPSFIRKALKRCKRDSYFNMGMSELVGQSVAIAATDTGETGNESADEDVANSPAESLHPMLLQLKQSAWSPPPGFQLQSQFGRVVSGCGNNSALDALEADDNVERIEASRPAGMVECSTSVPFVRGSNVQPPPALSHNGDRCVVAFIDTGIDILHAAFRDGSGNSRVIEVWDQADPAGPAPDAIYPQLRLNYGRVYTAADIAGYLANPATVPPRLRDPKGHGTHVASIAAGSEDTAPGGFYGGIARAQNCRGDGQDGGHGGQFDEHRLLEQSPPGSRLHRRRCPKSVVARSGQHQLRHERRTARRQVRARGRF